MYISMLYLYESEIQTPRESQLKEIIHRVNISFRYRWLLTWRKSCEEPKIASFSVTISCA